MSEPYKTAMWIDDEADQYLSYAEGYKRKGIEVQYIFTITRAIVELKKKAESKSLPEMILLDIMMPGSDPMDLDGEEFDTDRGFIAGLVFYKQWLKVFLEKNKINNKVIPVIALTHLSTPSATVEEIKASGMTYVVKNSKSLSIEIPNILLGKV